MSCALEQAACLSGNRIGLGSIGKGKDVGREENRRGGLRVARGLGEAIIEAAAAGSGNVSQNAIERDPSFFVGIEILIEKIAKKAAVLRNAFAVDARRGSDGIGGMFGIGRKVADRSKAPAGHDGIGDDVNVFINLARLKAAVEMDISVARDEFAVDGLRELPLRARE